MSDILIEYAKIAEKHGLLTPEKKKTAEENDDIRYDSHELDSIGLLYGVQPNGKDEKHIFEQAHPETEVIGRSYDAMNAVVETPHQRQSIMADIALKTPNGHITQKRYVAANNKLLNALLRAGFAMEGKDEGLMKLADSCAERLEKEAAIPAAILAPKVIGMAAVGLTGLVYYFGYSATPASSVAENAGDALEILQDLSDQPYYSSLNSTLTNIKQQAEVFYANKNEIVANSMEDIIDKAKDKKTHDMIRHMNGYYKQLVTLKGALPNIIKQIQLAHSEEIAGETWYEKFIWEPYEKLIDRLWGQGNWFTSGRTGGLYEAIDFEIKSLQAAVQAAKANKPVIDKLLKEKSELVKEHGIPDLEPANETKEPENLLKMTGNDKSLTKKAFTLEELLINYGDWK